MTNELKEACKTIAEFMGECCNNECRDELICRCGKFKLLEDYSTSLDALVPVWERVNCYPSFDRSFPLTRSDSWVAFLCENKSGKNISHSRGETIQQAACLATAKAIKELGEKE